MQNKLEQEYHFIVLDLMETDPTYKWNRILKEENFNYILALEKIKEILLEIVTNYDEIMIMSDGAELEIFICDLNWTEDLLERFNI